MGCASGKSADANDVVLIEAKRTTSAIKGGQQSFEVKANRRSINYQAEELDDEALELAQDGGKGAQFDLQRLGTNTLHGVMPMPGAKKKTSKAKINQDRGVLCWPFCGSYNEALLCVFDGHGSRGEKASEFCMTRLPELLAADRAALVADPAACMKANLLTLDEELRTTSAHSMFMDGSGTTAVVVYLRGQAMWVANVGDSRAVKASREGPKGALTATDLSVDHKLDSPSERERIEGRGGDVRRSDASTPLRVYYQGATGLAMSRSIGDGALKLAGVTAEADVTNWVVDPASAASGDLFLILASDGVWEFIPSQVGAHAGACALAHPGPPSALGPPSTLGPPLLPT